MATAVYDYGDGEQQRKRDEECDHDNVVMKEAVLEEEEKGEKTHTRPSASARVSVEEAVRTIEAKQQEELVSGDGGALKDKKKKKKGSASGQSVGGPHIPLPPIFGILSHPILEHILKRLWPEWAKKRSTGPTKTLVSDGSAPKAAQRVRIGDATDTVPWQYSRRLTKTIFDGLKSTGGSGPAACVANAAACAAAGRMPYIARTLVYGIDCLVILCNINGTPSCIIADREMVFDTPPQVCELPSRVWESAARTLEGTVLIGRRLEHPGDPRDHKTPPVRLIFHDCAVAAGYSLVGNPESAPLIVRLKILANLLVDVIPLMQGITVEAAPHVLLPNASAVSALIADDRFRNEAEDCSVNTLPHDILKDVLHWHRHEDVVLMFLEGKWYEAADGGGSMVPCSLDDVQLYSTAAAQEGGSSGTTKGVSSGFPPLHIPSQGATLKCFLVPRRGIGPSSEPSVIALAYGVTRNPVSFHADVVRARQRTIDNVPHTELFAWMTGSSVCS